MKMVNCQEWYLHNLSWCYLALLGILIVPSGHTHFWRVLNIVFLVLILLVIISMDMFLMQVTENKTEFNLNN